VEEPRENNLSNLADKIYHIYLLSSTPFQRWKLKFKSLVVIGTDIYVDVNPVFMQSDQRLRNACVSSNILEKYGGKL
jgi:hypothetical protein